MQDISEWLTEHKLAEYCQAFVDNGITIDLLDELNQDDLKEIGLTLGDRKRFLIAVRQGTDSKSPLHSASNQSPDNSGSSQPDSAIRHPPSASGATAGTVAGKAAGKAAGTRAGTTAGATGPGAPDTHAAERRQLTVMFVDLVGSTAMAEQLDPEDMGQVVRDYQRLVGQCIADNGGYISRYMGDGVLAYFGWPAASEDDATHAVDSALAITASITTLKTPDRKPCACRCGIATGLVVVGELIGEGPSMEHAVVGETPNLAARLQGLASENSTVISDATRRLVGNHFELQPLGLQALKGIRDPVPVFSVINAKNVESRFHASRQNSALPLVGRQRQLEQLQFYWQQTITGHATRVLLQGEAGIGKSRLLHAFIDSIGSATLSRVILQCDPLRSDSSLYPATRFLIRLAGIEAADSQALRWQKLQSVAGALPPVEVAGMRSDVLPLLAVLLELRNAGPGGESTGNTDYSAEQIRLLTLHALAAVMRAPVQASDESLSVAKPATGANVNAVPLLLVLEDAHWIDPTTVELLAVLARPDTTCTTMLLITARPEFEPSALAFEDLSTIQLPRLGTEACREVVRSVIGDQSLPDHILNEIVLKTDGVPLFAEELTRTVIESSAIRNSATESNNDVQSLEIPSSLHDSLMSRLDRLQSPREVAQTAACIGREFSVDLLLAIAKVDEQGLHASLQTLLEAGLIFTVSETSYSFKHALVRDTAYESLLKSKRQQIHLQIGQALQSQFPDLLSSQPELAGYHFRRAARYIEASGYWHQAAKLALQRVANREAIAHAGSGLECIDLALDDSGNAAPANTTRKYDLLFIRGMGYMALHGYAAETVSSNFNAAMDIAADMEDNERFSQAARGVVTAHIVSSRFDAGLTLADTMLQKAENDMQQFYALRMQGQIYLWQARFEESRRCFERAIEHYDSRDQSALSQWDDGVLCTGFLGITLTCLGLTDKGDEKHRQSVDMAHQLNQPFSQCQALESWITSILLRGDDFSVQLDTMSALAETHNMVFFQACAQMYSGIQNIRQGAVSSGITILTEGLKRYQACQSKLGVPKWMTYVAEGYQSADKHDQTIQMLDRAKTEMDEMGNEYFRAEWSRVRAESLAIAASHDSTQADTHYAQAIRLAQAQGARLFELTAVTGLARHKLGGAVDCDVQGQLRSLVETFGDQQPFAHLITAKKLLQQIESVVA